MKYSEPLESFLAYLREIQREHGAAAAAEQAADNATQDILHSLELCDNSYHECARLAGALRAVRQERRAAKDRRLALQPVADWASRNAKAVKGLESLLGQMRRTEKNMESRSYKPKTDIVDKALEKWLLE